MVCLNDWSYCGHCFSARYSQQAIQMAVFKKKTYFGIICTQLLLKTITLHDGKSLTRKVF